MSLSTVLVNSLYSLALQRPRVLDVCPTSGLSTAVLLEFLSRNPVTSAFPLSHNFRVTSPICVVRLPHVRLLQRLGLDYASPVFDSNDGIATLYDAGAGWRFRGLYFLVFNAPRDELVLHWNSKCPHDIYCVQLSHSSRHSSQKSSFLRVVFFGSHVAMLTHLLVQVSLISKC